MNKTFIGIDNGVSGSLGIISAKKALYLPIPIRKVLNYTKTKKWLHRICGKTLKNLLLSEKVDSRDVFALIERPMVNPGRFQASISAIRAMEATLIVLEDLEIPYEFLDSKQWQKELLPSGLESEELKEASLQVGKRLFPKIDFKKFKDADGLLIAEYARRTYGNTEKN